MIGLNEKAQTILTIVMIVFALILIGLQLERRTKTYLTMSRTDKTLWLCELLTVICLVVLVIVLVALYWKYIPANSPGCLPHISQFGVVASAVSLDKSVLAAPITKIPAVTYAAAIVAYRNSPNGLANGYFAWDGVSVTILNSNAYQLASGAPPGNNWVFQDLSTAVARNE